jgi:hypothetical protein
MMCLWPLFHSFVSSFLYAEPLLQKRKVRKTLSSIHSRVPFASRGFSIFSHHFTGPVPAEHRLSDERKESTEPQ